MCKSPPYLPLEDGSNRIFEGLDYLLDKQFRLLREDMMSTLCEELKSTSPRNTFPVLKVCGIMASEPDHQKRTGKRAQPARWGAGFKCQLQTKNCLPPTLGTLICVVHNAQPCLFATVVQLQATTVNAQQFTVILDSMQSTLMPLHPLYPQDMKIVEVSSSFFSYEPVLRALKLTEHLPFRYIASLQHC